jgi:hypothetical protein
VNYLKKYRQLIAGLVIGSALTFSTQSFAEDGIYNISALLRLDLPIFVDGKEVELSNPPISYSSVTYLPLREVGRLVGKEVKWNSATKSIEIGGTLPTPTSTQTPITTTQSSSTPQSTTIESPQTIQTSSAVSGKVGDELESNGIKIKVVSLIKTTNNLIEIDFVATNNNSSSPVKNIMFKYELQDKKYEEEFNKQGYNILGSIDWLYEGDSANTKYIYSKLPKSPITKILFQYNSNINFEWTLDEPLM